MQKEQEAQMEEGGSLGLKAFRMPELPKPLKPMEKQYLLAVERGDVATMRSLIDRAKLDASLLDIDCVDPIGRGALLMAIENENLELVRMLIELGVNMKDSLLHAINSEFVEAVELLLEQEESIHVEGQPHSWETVSPDISSFTPEITPLILAAHKDNYEIVKLLLDRGATLPVPHDIRCVCDVCLTAVKDDSLYHSRSRLNAYKALCSSSLIALSSKDPILTAFELSWELKNLANAERESKDEYLDLKNQCQQFAVDLLGHARTSQELEIILNHDPDKPPHQIGDHMELARLELSINYKQKKFVAHPNVQQMLSTMWYEGLPGFLRKTMVQQLMDVVLIALLFPYYACLYMLFPNSSIGKLMRKPFYKFLIHSSSYLFFLFLLILASQQIETIVVQLFGTEAMNLKLQEQLKRHRGNPPTLIETSILLYVLGFIWEETRQLWSHGLKAYISNMWNIIDFTRNSLYLTTIGLRLLAYLRDRRAIAMDPNVAFTPREEWDDFDPILIAEGLFAAANIFSAIKLVHMFSINPYLGPLQISLGRMVIDITKFFFIYTLVLFAFACGLNQLLRYYAELERQQCYSSPDGEADWENNPDSCMAWRRFINLFEASQSLFWASFGMIDLRNFELSGIKSYTRFWGMLMFGSYSVINVIVLLNLLIAMMSNSYNIISERSDIEWKFARTKLWLSYFEEGSTVPPPFNLIITPKVLLKWFGCRKKQSSLSSQRKELEINLYQAVMQAIVWRYVSSKQRSIASSSTVTEDDVNEIKQDISAFKFELMDVLKKNGMGIDEDYAENKGINLGRKVRMWERLLTKGFDLSPVESCAAEMAPEVDQRGLLRKLKRGSGTRGSRSALRHWGDLVHASRSQIGHSKTGSQKSREESKEKSVASVTETSELQKSSRPLTPRSTQMEPQIKPEVPPPPPPPCRSSAVSEKDIPRLPPPHLRPRTPTSSASKWVIPRPVSTSRSTPATPEHQTDAQVHRSSSPEQFLHSEDTIENETPQKSNEVDELSLLPEEAEPQYTDSPTNEAQQPLVDIDDQPLVDNQEQPLVDVTDKPLVDVEDQPLIDIQEQPLVDIPSPADFSSTPEQMKDPIEPLSDSILDTSLPEDANTASPLLSHLVPVSDGSLVVPSSPSLSVSQLKELFSSPASVTGSPEEIKAGVVDESCKTPTPNPTPVQTPIPPQLEGADGGSPPVPSPTAELQELIPSSPDLEPVADTVSPEENQIKIPESPDADSVPPPPLPPYDVVESAPSSTGSASPVYESSPSREPLLPPPDRPARKVPAVTTLRRQPKTGWL